MAELTFYTTETPKVTLTLSDGTTDQYPQAYIYNIDTTLNETVNLTHIANGMYEGDAVEDYSTIEAGLYTVVYKVFSDAGHSTPNTDYSIAEDKIRMIDTTAVIADAVWNEPEVDHVTVGTYGYDVPIRPLYGGGSRGGLINYDAIATKVWSHDKAKKGIDNIKIIKKTTKENKTLSIEAIKRIKGITIPESLEVNLKPVFDKIDNIDFKSTLEKMITNIPKPPKLDLTSIINKIDDLKIDVNKKKGLVISGNKEPIDYTKTFAKLRTYLETTNKEDKKKTSEIMQQLNKLSVLLEILNQEDAKRYKQLINELKRELTQ